MKHIAFYIINPGISEVDCRNLLHGNPGIGGSEYAMFLLAYSLGTNYRDLNITVYTHKEGILPENMRVKTVENRNSLAQKVKEDGVDILVLRCDSFNLDVFHRELKIVVLAQNYIQPKQLRYLAVEERVYRIVCVSNEQLNLYSDHAAYRKSVAIYNPFCAEKIQTTDYSMRPMHVTYIGSLIRAKGFHVLAKAWKTILEACPDAFLNVIGSGNLYNRQTPLGRYGIAASAYEQSFMPYLTDGTGKILPSVKFWGILGREKADVLQHTRVGVPNPSGVSETFGYTAVEMQAYGCLIATIKCPAYAETVYSGAGILYRNEKDLAGAVITLLNRDNNNYQETMNYISSHFALEKVADEWRQLFLGTLQPSRKPAKIKWGQYAELNRKIKNFIPYGYKLLPSIYTFWDLYQQQFKSLIKRKGIIRYLFRKFVPKNICNL
ncbi:MAG: glycosyltransferase family 4 protein [Prevotellaceae bacterium]|jgi:glycosyltransferase involved in cell wall biosynthesis|nr:glycosyltransferase family 4 protein [Prevotellaceae bacterium]